MERILMSEKRIGSWKKSEGLAFMFGANTDHSAVKCAVVTASVDWRVNNFEAEELTKGSRWHF